MRFALVLFTFMFSLLATAAPVKIDFTHTNMKEGTILIAIFNDPGQFPDKKPLLTRSVTFTKNQTSIELNVDLPRGDYAISAFLDENNNKKLDTNFLGIPKERFGFSNNPRILTGAPNFQDCEVRVSEAGNQLTIKLIKIL